MALFELFETSDSTEFFSFLQILIVHNSTWHFSDDSHTFHVFKVLNLIFIKGLRDLLKYASEHFIKNIVLSDYTVLLLFTKPRVI